VAENHPPGGRFSRYQDPRRHINPRSFTKNDDLSCPNSWSGSIEPTSCDVVDGHFSRGDIMASIRHLLWLPLGALVGFGASFLFGDLIELPVDLYYLVYFAITFGFFLFYVKRTALDLRRWISRRILWGVLAGVVVGVVMMQNVLSRPATESFSGAFLWWAIFWRGLVYGTVDGLLLFAFPWIVVWRAFGAEEKKLPTKLGAAAVSWIAVLFMTTAYHLGYADFRSEKIMQPNIGSTISILPTLVTANPVSSPITHVFLHVTAVVHSPGTDLFLPPHREAAVRGN
jgi:hypothetical protein